MENYGIIELIIDLAITIVVYLSITFIIRFGFKKQYNKKNSIGIAIGISSLGYIIYIFLYGALKIEGIPRIPVAVSYTFISYGILHNKKLDKKNNIPDNEELKKDNTKLTEIENKNTNNKNVDKEVQMLKKKSYNGWKIATIVFIIITVFMFGIINYYSFYNNNLKKDIEKVNSEISKLKTEKNEISKKYNSIKTKTDFYDKYAVIIPSNTKIYHKYDCTYCDKSNFKILNIGIAENNGYTPCSHCIK